MRRQLRWRCAKREGRAGFNSGPNDGAVSQDGGVFVLPAIINGGTKSYFIVDSGAANVQIRKKQPKK